VKPEGTVENTEDGLKMLLPAISAERFETPLCGDFNVDNVMLVLSWANAIGIPEAAMRKAIATVRVPGRFEKVWNKNGRHVIVDYAHTPDALERVLTTARSLCRGKLSCVFGCGGDRDKTKRPEMADIASKGSDKLVLTSDNPRTEKPEAILDDMEAGLTPEQLSHTVRITDRRQAIRTACMMAREGDIILIAGKGHEKYQEVNGVRSHFDDVEEVEKELSIKS
jgi:UDP-N-acetylmuramoyl-L-alanyl-D-glutamate--2,6-diaminopimelate ligase